MIRIFIPGFGDLTITDIVMDYNGTLAVDGKLIEGLSDKLNELAGKVNLHVVTADTFGFAADELKPVRCKLEIIGGDDQQKAKLDYISLLGKENTAAVGNGRNDSLMVKNAVLGIALLQEEGASPETLYAADVVCRDIFDVLNLFFHQKRLIAALRA